MNYEPFEHGDQTNQINLGCIQDSKLDNTKLITVAEISSCNTQESTNTSKLCRSQSLQPHTGKVTGESPKLATESNANEYSGMWEKMFHRLLKFLQQNGHCRVPFRYAADPQLGAWVATQRRNYKLMRCGRRKKSSLTPQRELKLIQIGFEWSATNPRGIKEMPKLEVLNSKVQNPNKKVKNRTDLLSGTSCRFVTQGDEARIQQTSRRCKVLGTIPSAQLQASIKTKDLLNSNYPSYAPSDLRAVIGKLSNEHKKSCKRDKSVCENQLNSIELRSRLAAVASGPRVAVASGPIVAENNKALQRCCNDAKKYKAGSREFSFSPQDSLDSSVHALCALGLGSRPLHKSSFPAGLGWGQRNICAEQTFSRHLNYGGLMHPESDILSRSQCILQANAHSSLAQLRKEHARTLQSIPERLAEKRFEQSNYSRSELVSAWKHEEGKR